MKKSIFYLGIALLGIVSPSVASNSNSGSNHETNVYAKYYGTPLCVAISKGELDLVKKFIEYGADIHEKTNGLTPLMYAARYNQLDIVKFLISKGANPKETDSRGFSVLNHAENSRATEVVAYLKTLVQS